MRKETLPDDNFRKFGCIFNIAKMLFHSALHGSFRKFKPDVLIELNGALAKVTKFVTNCAPFARARESSTEKVSQVTFCVSMVNEVMIQPD